MLADDGRNAIIIISVLIAVSTGALLVRLLLRKNSHILGLDDWLLCGALVLIYAEAAGAFVLAIKGQEGRPFETLTPDEREWLLKMFFWPELGYGILVSTIKLSVLSSYKRIFGTIKSLRVAIYLLSILVICWATGHFFTVLFQCTPIDKVWLPDKNGHCINTQAFYWGNSISNTVFDWVILFLPIRAIWHLQLATIQKLLLLGSFLLGTISCASSTVRAATTATVDKKNLSGTMFLASLWTYVEPNAAVVAACLPYLAPIFGRWVKSWTRNSQFSLRGSKRHTDGSKQSSFTAPSSLPSPHKKKSRGLDQKTAEGRALNGDYELMEEPDKDSSVSPLDEHKAQSPHNVV